MISRENYSAEHIRQLRNESRRDPVLIERALFAFGLLEALVNAGLKFTFKGGTSLMVLLSKPMRLSTDIDIVVDPKTKSQELFCIFTKRSPDSMRVRGFENRLLKCFWQLGGIGSK